MKLRALSIIPLVAGCVNLATVSPVEDVSIPGPGEYHLCTKITLTETVAESMQKATELCGFLVFACGTINPAAGLGHEVITDAPKSFNDHPALIRLGHEVLHNLGGVHR